MKTKLLVLTIVVSLTLICLVSTSSHAELVAYWPLDEGGGEEIEDATGNGYVGTFHGDPEWLEGVFGMALEFDGDDYVEVPDASEINPESITLATWVYFNVVDSAVMERQDYLSRGDDYAFSLHEWNADQKIYGIVTSGGGWSVVNGNTVVEPDTWYHTAMTYDSSTQMLILYLDGEVDGELSVPGGLEHRLGGPLTIGTYQDRYLLGRLDEVKIWNEALSEEQIKSDMAPTSVDSLGKLAITWGGIKDNKR